MEKGLIVIAILFYAAKKRQISILLISQVFINYFKISTKFGFANILLGNFPLLLVNTINKIFIFSNFLLFFNSKIIIYIFNKNILLLLILNIKAISKGYLLIILILFLFSNLVNIKSINNLIIYEK